MLDFFSLQGVSFRGLLGSDKEPRAAENIFTKPKARVQAEVQEVTNSGPSNKGVQLEGRICKIMVVENQGTTITKFVLLVIFS